jgi:hypothetical protein
MGALPDISNDQKLGKSRASSVGSATASETQNARMTTEEKGG